MFNLAYTKLFFSTSTTISIDKHHMDYRQAWQQLTGEIFTGIAVDWTQILTAFKANVAFQLGNTNEEDRRMIDSR